MNFVTQLLPGLRDVRAPLIAGYLWLLSGWLLLADHLPQRNGAEVYAHAFEIGDAVGRVALLGALSMVAYVVGSLLQAVPEWITYNSRRLARQLREVSLEETSGISLPLTNAERLLNSPPLFAPTDFHAIDGDDPTRRILEDLVNGRLGKVRRDLERVLWNAGAMVRSGVESTGAKPPEAPTDTAVAIGAFGTPRRGWEALNLGAMVGNHAHISRFEAALPTFSAHRDLFEERRSIQTRLMETAQHAGSEVERLYSESEFRFTIALPLAVVAVVLAVESRDFWWLALLGVAAGLLVHSMVLRKHAGRELVEALRSRPSAAELDQVTPVFARYEENAEDLIRALSGKQWEELGALAVSEPNSEAVQAWHRLPA